MRYGTIGTGWITEAFIQGAALVENMELCAVYSRNMETGKAFSKKYGLPTVFTDLTQMAESDMIDGVYIASPNSLHYEQSKLFLAHGKHVLCEKPIAVTSAQTKELTALAKEKNLIYMEAIMMLHLPARKRLKDAIQKIGTITTARFDFSQLSSKYQRLVDGELPNIFNPKFATGCLMDLGVYCVYAALDLFGTPEKTMTTAGFLSGGADGYGNSVFIYKDKQVNISYSKIGQSRLGSEIMGDKGTIVIGSIANLTNIKIIWNDGREEPLVGDVPKHVLMSGEAESFYHYSTNTEKYKQDYQYAGDLSNSVCTVMESMREQADIKFV